MDLKIDVEEKEGATLLRLDGEVDVYTAPKLKSQIIDLVDQGKFKIVVDLERVDFMDSSGLGVLVGGLKRVRSHDGAISLICSQENILKIFRITGLVKIFPIFDDEGQALQSV